MTQAKMDWKNLKLEMKGHAGSGPKGSDLVCCAESMLMQALVQTLEDMKREGMTDVEWTGAASQGYLMVEADPAQGREAEVRMAFRVCVTGLRMIAEKYADYIELREDR